MGMTVRLQTSAGTTIASVTEGAVDLSRVLPPFADPAFPYLGLIDPYGDTWFSSLQMHALLPEIRRLRSSIPEPSGVLMRVEELAQQCAASVHIFLRFVGD